MARFAVAGRSTVAGTALRPIASVYATTAVRPAIREIGVFNTTATAVAAAVVRMTNATGIGSGLTEVCLSDSSHVAITTGFAGHTADGGVGAQVRQASLGAAIGSGVIWTFADPGLVVPNTAADGVGVICPTGTGQILDYYIEWEE